MTLYHAFRRHAPPGKIAYLAELSYTLRESGRAKKFPRIVYPWLFEFDNSLSKQMQCKRCSQATRILPSTHYLFWTLTGAFFKPADGLLTSIDTEARVSESKCVQLSDDYRWLITGHQPRRKFDQFHCIIESQPRFPCH